ncbi:gephyrin-like molybdotransferase Glp [Actinomyces trachealis]|uniref:molybdopterin molybdotransferase MoeA n=1 Tax=Actinomyces trachealis TaxID=2763540 RepID=UPI001FD5E51B|nr:gephyrin-like molybdotransferase Glp [Actinomyces trachealis]
MSSRRPTATEGPEMAHAPQMLSPEEYLDALLSTLAPLPAGQVPLADAHGLVLAQDLRARLPVPAWTNSAMDGYAVRAAQTVGADRAPVRLPVSGDVPAGAAPGPLAPGTAMRIMTGAMLPEGADAIVRVEDTDQEPGQAPLPREVEVRARARAGLNVRRAGEDVAVGDPVARVGTVLSAAVLSSLASVGLSDVRAHPRPRVAVVSTGTELVDAGTPLAPGSVPDSNGLLLQGLLAEHGALTVAVLRVGDTAADLARVLREAAEAADLVVTSGGVSAGAFDPFTMLAASHEHSRGTHVSFAKVAMQPGKPQGHGTVLAQDGRQVPVIMLPGNPVSVLVSFTVFVAPALAVLSGHGRREVAASLVPVAARAAVGWRAAGERRQYLPARLVAPADGEGRDLPDAPPWVAPVHRLGSGSHLVASLGSAQALAVVEAHTPAVEPGQEVGLLLLTHPASPLPTYPTRERRDP